MILLKLLCPLFILFRLPPCQCVNMFYREVNMFAFNKRKRVSLPGFSLKNIPIHFGTKYAYQSLMSKEESLELTNHQHKRGAVFLLFVLLLLLWITPIHPIMYGPLFSPFSMSPYSNGILFHTAGSIPERDIIKTMFPSGLPL